MYSRLCRSEKGQALVEFVILLPLVIYMIFMLGDYSRVYYSTRLLDERFNQITLGEYRNAGEVLEIPTDTAYLDGKSNKEIENILNNIVLQKDPWLYHNIDGDIKVEKSVLVRRPGSSYDEVESAANIVYNVRSLVGSEKSREVKKRLYTFRYIPST